MTRGSAVFLPPNRHNLFLDFFRYFLMKKLDKLKNMCYNGNIKSIFSNFVFKFQLNTV